MKKYLWLLVVSISFATTALTTNPVHAQGQIIFRNADVEVVNPAPTGIADGKTPYSFTLRFYGYKCELPGLAGDYFIYMSRSECDTYVGDGDLGSAEGATRVEVNSTTDCCISANVEVPGTNIISGVEFSTQLTGANYELTRAVAHPNADGVAVVSFTTKQAGAKVIQYDNTYAGLPRKSFSVSFAAPVTPAPVPHATQTPAAPITARPAVITIKPSDVAMGGKQLSDDPNATKQDFIAGKPIRLAGKSLPNAVINLYIFSEPHQAQITADAQGNWNYSITGLPAGKHHVEIQVTNPADGGKSDRIVLSAFTVKQPASVALVAANSSTTQAPYSIRILSALVVATLVVVGVMYRRQILWHVTQLAKRK